MSTKYHCDNCNKEVKSKRQLHRLELLAFIRQNETVNHIENYRIHLFLPDRFSNKEYCYECTKTLKTIISQAIDSFRDVFEKTPEIF